MSYLNNTPFASNYAPEHRTAYTPCIVFDAKQGILEIAGEAYAEYAVEFFQPLLEILTAFTSTTDNSALTVAFKMTYFNTSTSRCFFEIFDILEKYHLKGGKVKCNWYYQQEDLDIFDSGVEFSFQVSFDFEYMAF